MLLFSTILYINGLPVDYNVEPNEEGYLFDPVFNIHEDLNPPRFTLTASGDRFAIPGSSDEDLLEQASEDLRNYLKSRQQKRIAP